METVRLHYTELPTQKNEDGSIIVYDNVTDQTHLINETAAYVFELCTKENSLSIAQKLAEKFEGIDSIEEVVQDVEDIIEDFLSKGLLQKMEVKNECEY